MPLERDFVEARAGEPDALLGDHAVHLVSDLLPVPLRFFGHTKVFRREGDRIVGSNRFLGGLVETGRFRVEKGTASDGVEVTRIVYDDARNPFFMRPLTDEVKRVRDGRWLGRGVFRVGPLTHRAFWFTVSREA